MFRFLTRARVALRRSLARIDRAVDHDMPVSSTHTALRHYWIDPLTEK